MPDNGNLQHDIALLERAIEYGVETLTSGAVEHGGVPGNLRGNG
jgi:hypothetical protein